jgi:RNA polymerase sigma-70 factor, ECF subfamily
VVLLVEAVQVPEGASRSHDEARAGGPVAMVVAMPPTLTSGEAVTDAQLLVATGDGDSQAFATLYQRHAPWLFLRLGRRCADPGLVEEAVQDAFVAVWRSAGSWDGRGEVPAWLWGIAYRRLIDAMRHRPAPAAALVGETDVDAEPSAEDYALTDVRYSKVGAALARLPQDLRDVMRATVVDGLTTKEAARLLGIPAGTVKTRMMRTRIALREDLA